MIFFRAISDAVAIAQDIRNNILSLSMADNLTIAQTIRNNQHIELISQALTTGQRLHGSILPQSITQHISINQDIQVTKILSRIITNHLSLGSIVVRNKTAAITQALSIGQVINLSPLEPSIIVISEGIIYHVSKPIADELTITQNIHLNKVLPRIINQHLDIVQFVYAYKLDRRFIAIPVPAIVPAHKIILTYGTLRLELRDPEFGNSEKYEQSRILRRNRGNELNIYRDTIWPDTNTLSYSFKALKQKDVHNLLYFMNKSLGQTIQLLDHENNTWEGIISTPEKEVVEEGRIGFSASFEFIGNRI